MTPPLHARRSGADTGGPIVLMHGFTQTTECWGRFGELLAIDHAILAIDLPGHGSSTHARGDLATSADMVAETIVTNTSSATTVVGYSLGGRVALHLALQHPQQVDRLVLIGATGGIEDEQERAQRRIDDERLADHIEDIGVTAFIDEWLSQPLFASLDPDQACRDARLANTDIGLASSLRSCGTGTQDPLWDRLRRLEMPVLVLAGENDTKFAALGRRLVESIGTNATFASIRDSGHSTHLEQPDSTAQIIEEWLADHRS